MSIKIPAFGLKKMAQTVGFSASPLFHNRSLRGMAAVLGGLLLLLSGIGLFFEPAVAGQKTQTKVVERADELPVAVRRMHRAILQAARSGELENLREVLERNELMPLIDGAFVADPVKHWKAGSVDGSGREILALLSELLELPPVKRTTGKTALYVWPFFAGVPLQNLSPPQLVRLYRLMPGEKAGRMLKAGRYGGAYLTIGADGTWHSFGRAFK